MKLPKLGQMLAATRLTGEGRLAQATALIQSMLQGGEPAAHGHAAPSPAPGAWNDAPTIDGVAEPETGRARFTAEQYEGPAGSRPFKLYVPSGHRGQATPLIVMLHGCTQSPDDFAAGTRMNEAAEAANCVVAWPAQTSAANMQKCWNWFNAAEQQRGQGEPAVVAGIVRQVMAHCAIDPRRVYVAGLSAGGAAAAVLGATYPDLFAAVGVHSGLACGAARDMPSGFAAMSHPSAGRPLAGGGLPTIVFHGERDSTVHPGNGDAVIAQAIADATLTPRRTKATVPGGHAYTRTEYRDAEGRTVMERWAIAGAGHAWAGGSPNGSFTDPRGPDATREMLRFFLDHPRID